MGLYQFSLNIQCVPPTWLKDVDLTTNVPSGETFSIDNIVGTIPQYRLYLHRNNEPLGDLLTERAWHCEYDQLIREEIVVELVEGNQYDLKVEPVKSRYSAAIKFVITACDLPTQALENRDSGLSKPVTMRLTSSSNLLIIT